MNRKRKIRCLEKELVRLKRYRRNSSSSSDSSEDSESRSRSGESRQRSRRQRSRSRHRSRSKRSSLRRSQSKRANRRRSQSTRSRRPNRATSTESSRSRSGRTRSSRYLRSQSPIGPTASGHPGLALPEEPHPDQREENQQGLGISELPEAQEISPNAGSLGEAEADIDDSILVLLGEAPEKQGLGPELLPHLCTRWQDILQNGLNKEKRIELVKKYPSPANLKGIDAPKINPELITAITETAMKKDKAIEAKQSQMSSAITALGQALNKLCKSGSAGHKDQQEIILWVSDATRLLLDIHHGDSVIRRLFILNGLEKSDREAIKDTPIDEWLFGHNVTERLKNNRVLTKTGQNLLKNAKFKKNQSTYLNSKGPAAISSFRNRAPPKIPPQRRQQPASRNKGPTYKYRNQNNYRSQNSYRRH